MSVACNQQTNAFTLHHFQSAAGMVFAVNSDPDTGDLYLNLQHVYANIYSEAPFRNDYHLPNL